MSRHSETRSESVASRKRATFSSLSMWVSACGWTTICSPYRSRTSRPSRSVSEVRLRHCSGVSVSGSSTSPVLSSRQKDGMTTRCSAPMAWASAALSATCAQVFSHTAGPWCRPVKTVPADTFRPRRAVSSVSTAGSVGR